MKFMKLHKFHMKLMTTRVITQILIIIYPYEAKCKESQASSLYVSCPEDVCLAFTYVTWGIWLWGLNE